MIYIDIVCVENYLAVDYITSQSGEGLRERERGGKYRYVVWLLRTL